MVKLLGKLFIKDYQNYEDQNVRISYGIMSGVFGFITNFLMAVAKIVVGLIFGALSIVTDGAETFADTTSSIITIMSYRLSRKPADKKHPFGYQRAEYIAGLILSVIILTTGFIFFVTAIQRIITPTEVTFSEIAVIILVVSLLMKLFQSLFYRSASKLIKSQTLKANSIDSLNDTISTVFVLAGYLIFYFTGKNLDGWFSLVVSIIIIFNGIKLIKEASSPLIGERPDPKLVEKIKERIMVSDKILGFHDLYIHSYGSGRKFVSVHVEMDSNLSLLECHHIIDEIERDFKINSDIDITIHIDPIEEETEEERKIKEELTRILKSYNEDFTYHDFRTIKRKGILDVIFDVAIPDSYKIKDVKFLEKLKKDMYKYNKNLRLFVNIDRYYIREEENE
ncbi:MAG TPA: cation diffusion facilitator family transporter [Bacilli bacterium]|nr:cation diffusion facilitator family transporter [Bacilli bacterium]HQO93785.1 cation diffusion facilitator family transporter [Bacilli bacterium]HQQ39268.1 cation diffusion facilitator family transporter [Bacilli bacterium]